MLLLYRLVLYLFFPLLALRLFLRASRNRRYFERLGQRFGFGLEQVVESQGGTIWIHAVSVGEVNAAVPLARHFLETYPEFPVVITTMTPTGSDRVQKLLGKSVSHCYLPYDYPGAVNRFYRAVNPVLGMVMETEIWPNLITHGHRTGVPLIYTNVRLSQRSFEGYYRFRSLFAPILRKVTHFAVQSQADAKRLIDLGADEDVVEVTGSIKFEIDLLASALEAAQSVRRDLGVDRTVWVAGSTHENEESQVLDAFIEARAEHPDLLLVLVPRHPERFNAVFRLCNRYDCTTLQRTQFPGALPEDTDVYLVDTMGELMLMIAAADFAFIGGSLVPTGGHNVLEACAASRAVIFGPHMFNFQEISDMVLARGAGVQVMDTAELADVAMKLATDPVLRDQYGSAGREFVEENRGALDTITRRVEPILRSKT